jgi:hypothetical protein
MRIILPCIFILLVFSAFLFSPPGCDKYKNGRFYLYSPATFYTIIRQDTMQLEIDKKSGDSTWWKVKWVSPCTYLLKFISSTEKMDDRRAEFFTNTLIKVSIVKTTPGYYIYDAQGTWHDIQLPASSDTIWMQERNKWAKFD